MRAELCPFEYKISAHPRTSLCCCEVGLIYRELLSARTIDAGEKESFECSVNVPADHFRCFVFVMELNGVFSYDQ